MSDLLALAEDFDAWRASYDSLSFDDQKLIYERLRQLHPTQRHSTLKYAYPFFDQYEPRTVVELGGWDGWLATCILEQHPEMRLWTNHDLVVVPPTCISPRYRLSVLQKPFWSRQRKADVFVATHTIEHIKRHEVEALVGCLRVDACLIESPIEATPRTWDGFEGTHVLEVGWDDVDAIFAAKGFVISERWRFGRYYER